MAGCMNQLQKLGGGEYQIVSYVSGFGINLFALISGYVGIRIGSSVKSILSKERFTKLTKLWFLVLFYSLILYILIGLIFSFENFLPNLIKVVLPVSSKQYWYFSAYVGVYLLAPGLNLIAEGISEKIKGNVKKILSFFLCIVIVCVMWSDPFSFVNGYTVAWLSFLYIVGGVIAMTHIKEKVSIGALISFLVIFILVVLAFDSFLPFKFDLLSRTSPINLIPICVILLLFSKIKVSNNFIRNFLIIITPSIFSIYLIHDNIYFRKHFISGKFLIDNFEGIHPLIYLFLSAVSIMALCIFIDQIRIKVLRKIKRNKDKLITLNR